MKNYKKIITPLILVILMLIITACSSAKVSRLIWGEDLVKDVRSTNYLYWKDGLQYITRTQDSLTVSYSGVEIDGLIFIFASIHNQMDSVFTFYPGQSKIVQANRTRVVELSNMRPSDRGSSTQLMDSFLFVLNGLGSVSSSFFFGFSPVNMVSSYLQPTDISGTAVSEFEKEKDLAKNLFLNIHTIFPKAGYAGFLVFEYDDAEFDAKKGFKVSISINGVVFESDASLNLL
ncbi:MAG: hypothetical protein KJ799_15425 [Bacteroidetes bacterium]|nr:hypothetical protein [Bacteroidota bacterium]MBU1679579.1 hypothetical protein [Bacteroidota bacterium]MBU2508093.1 hypothetical protein [Bacteroidota bacterium]